MFSSVWLLSGLAGCGRLRGIWYLGLALVFAGGGAPQGGGVWLLFFGAFLLVLAGLLFSRGDGYWAIILWGLDTFLIFPNFQRS